MKTDKSILALAGDAVVQLLSKAGGGTESSPDTKLMSVIRTVVNRSVAKAFQSSAFQIAAKRAVQKRLAKLHVFNVLATLTVNALAFTVPVSSFARIS